MIVSHAHNCDCDACCMALVKPIGRPFIRGQAPLDSRHRRKPQWRVLRELANGARVDIPNGFGSDSMRVHAVSADEAIKQAREFGHTGNLIAIPVAS